jgi:hypothetical protein
MIFQSGVCIVSLNRQVKKKNGKKKNTSQEILCFSILKSEKLTDSAH